MNSYEANSKYQMERLIECQQSLAMLRAGYLAYERAAAALPVSGMSAYPTSLYIYFTPQTIREFSLVAVGGLLEKALLFTCGDLEGVTSIDDPKERTRTFSWTVDNTTFILPFILSDDATCRVVITRTEIKKRSRWVELEEAVPVMAFICPSGEPE